MTIPIIQHLNNFTYSLEQLFIVRLSKARSKRELPQANLKATEHLQAHHHLKTETHQNKTMISLLNI
jgi:hypothetical protein